jgi:hypothetical protein
MSENDRGPSITTGERRRGGMTNTDVDWGRAALIGAVAGGVFWALTAFSIFATHGSPVALTVTGMVAIVAVLLGSIAYRSTGSAHNRCLAVGAILAPLTGAIAITVFCLGALLVQMVR